ncbi:MAG: Trk system potassium transporter TrkA [Akkermansiaceae bacterium]|nr:Trk system potassium transporter TrkA [Akkermansiaceae bacterium]
MNIIIVGAGEIGRHLAIELSRQEHTVSVIESDAVQASELQGEIEAKVVVGDGSSVNTLAEANIGDCELFLALTSENSVNLMCASMVKSMGVERVISRVHPGLQREEWLFDFRGHFGIDHIFSSERLAAIELAKFIRNPDSLVVEEIARGRIELQQVRVSPKSEVVGEPLKSLKFPANTRVALVSRGNSHEVANAETVLEGGDIVTVFGAPHKLRQLVGRLQKEIHLKDGPRVVIFGGGEYGFSLAQMLESWNCRVRIFERDPELAQKLTDRLSSTTVINADATSVAELEEEQVGEADFFVATSSSDEDNVMTCLQAHNLGAKNCLTLIHRADYAKAISFSGRHFGVVAAVSPREASRKEISRYVTTEKFHVVRKLGKGIVLQTHVAKGSKADGKTVAELKWPDGCVLVGLLKGLQAIVPGADDTLEAGDQIFAMVANKAERKFLRLVH